MSVLKHSCIPGEEERGVVSQKWEFGRSLIMTEMLNQMLKHNT